MALNFTGAGCNVVNFNGVILDGIDTDGDEPIRFIPANEEDEIIFNAGCASLNKKDDTGWFVEIDFSVCSNVVETLRQLQAQNLGDATMSVNNVCTGAAAFTTCAAILTKGLGPSFANTGIRTIRFAMVNPEFTSGSVVFTQ